MAHIQLPPNAPPGIVGLFVFRPETAGPIAQLTEAVLRGPSPLSRGERELMGAYVSKLNNCQFCTDSHACFSGLQLAGGLDVVDEVLADLDQSSISPKLKALLHIAGLTAQGGHQVTSEAVAAARAQGATDVEIHDTVLVAATFCLFNRYVDGLDTWTPPERAAFMPTAELVVERGYAAALPVPPSTIGDVVARAEEL